MHKYFSYRPRPPRRAPGAERARAAALLFRPFFFFWRSVPRSPGPFPAQQQPSPELLLPPGARPCALDNAVPSPLPFASSRVLSCSVRVCGQLSGIEQRPVSPPSLSLSPTLGHVHARGLSPPPSQGAAGRRRAPAREIGRALPRCSTSSCASAAERTL